jgi:hypothetical protein
MSIAVIFNVTNPDEDVRVLFDVMPRLHSALSTNHYFSITIHPNWNL